jgi:hypothetical protein
MIEKNNLLREIYKKNKKKLQKVDYDYWVEDIKFPDFTEEELEKFQSDQNFHFCIARIDNYNEILNHAMNHCNLISPEIFQQLASIGDSLVGYTDDQKKVISERSPRITSYVTANHLIYLTFLIKHFRFNEIEDLRILEFGGGYGNVCRLLFKLVININNYTIIDIPGMSRLQEFFLKKNLDETQLERILYSDSLNEVKKQKFDLVIANHSLSELPIEKYFESSEVLETTNYLFYSTCLGSHSEFIKIFHILTSFEIIELFFEGSIAHMLLKKINKKCLK